MTRLPTDTTIRHLFDSIRALYRKPDDKVWAAEDPKLIDALERRTLTAVNRDRSGSVTPDGYPSQTSGSLGHSEDSSTERAALALVDDDQVRDRHHELTALIVDCVDSIVVDIQRIAAALHSIDDLTNTQGPAPKTCASCTGKRGPDSDRPVAHRGTVGDRLERALDLCEHCWSFVRWSAEANTRNGYLPTDAQIRHHEETGRWRIRVA